MDLLEGLNPPQQAAVTHGDGPVLIFAGAGSGKTRTLTRRVAYLMRERKVLPSRILAVTFTNKAAREMRERLEQLAGPQASRIWMGTFHAMCAQMLRISGHLIGIDPRFVIFDSDDSARLMKDILREANVDSDRYPPGRILGRISDAKNNLRAPEDMASEVKSPYDRVVARLFSEYQQRLHAAHALDFDDLLGEAVRLLRDCAEAREYWSERFLHVLIDEFQDVNLAQFRWVQLLAQKHRNICVVGDDDQSIYAWRGANVKIILDFESTYPDAEVIRLEQNYRSTQNILDAAHGVISNNLGRKPKRLWTDIDAGVTLVLHGTANASEEAAWVVQQIKRLQRERDYNLADFAILCRVNAQSRPYEEAFMQARVPLRLVGTQRFYERKEIKDLIAYLKVLYNPHDSVAFGRIINVPPRGIGGVTIQKLGLAARETNRSVCDVILDEATADALGGTARPKLAALRELLQSLQNAAREETTIVSLLQKIIERTGYLEYLQRERTSESIDRTANVQEFLAAAALFDTRMQTGEDSARFFGEEYAVLPGEPDEQSEAAPFPGLFLESVTLDSEVESAPGTDSDAVTLMTLHSAKGLEFPVVFIVGLEQGLLPHARALWGEQAGADQLEEERRLCYVGLTRAREQVFLVYAAQRTLYGRTEWTQPSQFIDEMPVQLLQRSGHAKLGATPVRQAVTDWGKSAPATTNGASSPSKNGHDATPPKFGVGDKLKHPTFGEGLVVNASATSGPGEWVEVAFLAEGIGKKKLAVAYAPLEKV
ncbi:MAG TPA: UvrD-helicase domain-containing protein [Abditibacteriaceae bacterium]|nr:UvrD-helicase domain-containing protein [Abditibacteriaceae bacterium]